MSKNLERIWTKDFISIFITQFLLFVAFYALLTTLPIYVIDSLNGSHSEGGLVVTVMLISAILMRPFSAKLLEIVGKKKGLVLGVVTFTLTSFLYPFVNQFIPLLIVRFIHGLSFGIVTTATGAIAADVVPASRRGAGLGYFAMAMNTALVIGPFLGLSLLQITSFQNLFIVLNLLLLVGVISSLSVKVPTYLEVNKKTISFKLELSDLIEVNALPIALISGLVGMAYGSILSFISVYANSIGLATVASYFFLIFAVVMISSRPYLGRAFDNRGPKFVLAPSLFIFALGLLFLSFSANAAMFLMAAGLVGLGYGSLLPGFQTMAVQSTSPERSGHATATFFIFYDLGIGTGSFVWGIVASILGFSKMYMVSSALVIITLLIFNQYLSWKKKAKSVKKQKLKMKVQESKYS